MKLYTFFTCLLICTTIYAQKQLSLNDVQKHTHYFSISENYEFSENIQEMLAQGAKESQFIGIAEVHQSEQLSHFTAAFLRILKSHEFNNFALEIGDYATSILENISKKPAEIQHKLSILNKKYGKSRFPYVPFIFVDKIADVKFIQEASKLDFNLWGIDREYEFSYLLHFDKMYALSTKTSEITTAYQKARKILKKNAFKDKVSGESKYCWLLNEPSINDFLMLVSEETTLRNYANELKNSWKIYCRFATKKGGSTARATYMKRKFDSLYTVATTQEKLPKVLVKLGGVHLTHGNSQYGRYDVGRHLHEKAKDNNTNFLAIRHVWRYKNGKDQIGKSGWKNTRFLMQLGKKDQWTLIDLRPLKKLVATQQLQVDTGTAWELKNYDWFLISPNDSKGNINR
ncbi:hypothetical protein [uncultured Kordia sp.]|uniref:hypothetical protein n=1 Tax=uncultured Kordia sp. TaxID=507699 RepID=UPI002618CF86|nr:hypothetical protein [uncultured Kordia sp.]